MTDRTQPAPAQLLKEVRGLREEIRELLELGPELKETVEILRALKLGGKGVKWVAGIVTALVTLGGAIVFLRAFLRGQL